MDVEYLIIGQGICGTLLSYELHRAGRSFHVIDALEPAASSRVAAGMINPVTGRRIVKSWMVDDLLPFALNKYREIGIFLGIDVILETPIVDIFPNRQMEQSFNERSAEMPEYLSTASDADYNKYFKIQYGCGIIRPAYTVSTRSLIPAWRAILESQNLVTNAKFEEDNLVISDEGIRYGSLHATKIVFCNGHQAATLSLFRNLPFAANKGQALILRIPGLPPSNIYARGIKLVPLDNDIFWCGSSYEWNFDHEQPTDSFRDQTMVQLQDWLKIPFELIDQVAALRPATLERRPFVGFHPTHPSIGLFNGMGTKGFSLAPWFATQLVRHLLSGDPIDPAADVARFKKVLARSIQ